MGNDDPSIGNVGRDLGQALGDVFVGKAVETVAPDAFSMELVRDRVVIGERIMIAMERGIEAGDLRQFRKTGSSVLIGARLCGWCSGASDDISLQPR